MHYLNTNIENKIANEIWREVNASLNDPLYRYIIYSRDSTLNISVWNSVYKLNLFEWNNITRNIKSTINNTINKYEY